MSETARNTKPWKAVWAAGVAGGVVAGLGLVARVAILHDVSPLEDATLRCLQERGVSLVLQPHWTEPLVGLTEIAAFAALGCVFGMATTALRGSATGAACLTAAIGVLIQVLVGLLPRVPL